MDALNAAPAEIEAGKTYDHISVQFCPEGDSSGIQHLTVNGTVSIQGTTYATDPTAGLVPGATGADTPIDVHGGCASFYPLNPGFAVSESEVTKVKLFFDASLYVYGGVDDANSYVSDGSCAGTSSAYVCAPVVTVVPTIDSGNPTAEHYLIANTDAASGGSEDSAPTASVVLYYSSAGAPIGGVQNAYRLSGLNGAELEGAYSATKL